MKRKWHLLNSCMFIFCIGIAYAQYASSLSSHSLELEGFIGIQDQNNPPEVKIIAPENNSAFEWNTLVSYAISVEDIEDGASEYQEIALNEVFLEVVYLPDTSHVDDYLGSATHIDASLEMMKTSDCFNCHAVKTRMAGPSFSEVTQRYPHNPASVERLTKHVLEGSAGIWGSTPMPPHPNFTEEEVRQIIQWILENSEDPNWNLYAGTEGAFRTQAMTENEKNGVYILTATYTDHGLDDKQLRKQGRHTIVIRSK